MPLKAPFWAGILKVEVDTALKETMAEQRNLRKKKD